MTQLTINLKPDVNTQTLEGFEESYPHVFSRVQVASRVEIFKDELQVHVNENEEGYLLVLDGNPTIQIGNKTCQAEKGDLFHFTVSEAHGIAEGDGLVLVFHGRFNGRYEA
jgi:hypothetical protein